MFGIFTLLSILGLLYCFWRTSAKSSKGTGFFAWLIIGLSRLFAGETWSRAAAKYRDWTTAHYPGPLQWIFMGLTLGFGVLVVSGFVFSLLGFWRLRGFPLIAHVGAGGLFAVALALMLWIRSGDYGLGSDSDRKEGHSPHFLRILSFWVFVLSGLFLLLTALAMMMPLFSTPSLHISFTLHRYAALASLLSASSLVFLANRQNGK